MASDTVSYVQPYEPPSGAGRFTNFRRETTPMDILVFYDGSEEDVAKYLRGFLLWGYVALAVFALWSLVLLILFMRGRQRAGFLSSRPIAARGKVDATARDEEDWGDANQSTTSSTESSQRPRAAAPSNTLPNYIRIIFVMLCVLVFVLAVLFMTQGLQRLQETFDTYHSTAVRVEDITEQGQVLLDQGIEAVRDTIAVIRTVLDQESIAESFCPGVDIYQDVPGFAGTALSQVDRARDAFDQVGVARSAVNLVEDYIDGEVQDISSRLDKFGQDTSNAETELDKIHLVNGWTWFIFVCYAVIPLLMIISTVLAMHNRENLLLRRYTRFVAWPVFIILTLSLVATLVALPVAGGVNSDFCLPMGEGSSPDDLIFEVLQREGLAPGSFTYVTADFYIRQQCQDGEDPLDQVNFYLGELTDYRQSMNLLLGYVRDDTTVTEVCGRSFDGLTESVEDLDIMIDLLLRTGNDFKKLVDCSVLVPLYTKTVYDASCTNSMEAILWMYVTGTLLAVCSFGMMTMWAATRPFEP